MKPQKWILGSLAIAAGLIPQTSTVVFAQDNPFLSDTAAQPTSPTGATTSSLLPPVLVWNAQASSIARVGPWGNGTAQTTVGRTGTTLVVTTRNLEEGVRFDLNKPVDITPYQQAGFWRVRVQITGNTQGGGRGGGRTRGGAQGAAATGKVDPLTQLRLKLVLDNGVMSGVMPISQTGGGFRGRGGGGGQWQDLLIPVRNFASSPSASGLLHRIILTGDSTASFSLDQVALVAETNNITAIVRRDSDPPGVDVQTMTVKPGRSTTLVADVNGGTSDINVVWNFNADDSTAFPRPVSGWGGAGVSGGGRGTRGGGRGSAVAMAPAVGSAAPRAGMRGAPGVLGAEGGNPVVLGPRVDAVGLSARPDWPNEEQDYRVEVTITDRAGRKAPVKKSILVQVRAGN